MQAKQSNFRTCRAPCRKTRAVETALKQARWAQGSALVDVIVNPEELLIPPTINLEQIKDFMPSMIEDNLSINMGKYYPCR